jgi:hypothetical protein
MTVDGHCPVPYDSPRQSGNVEMGGRGMRRSTRNMLLAAALACGQLVAPSLAKADGAEQLTLELNRIDQIETACRFTFLAENALETDLSAFTVETVIIDTAGVVERLTLFEFGELPRDAPRVRQFDVPSLACADVGRVLINGVADCGGIENCAAAITLSNRTEIDLLG